MNDVSQIGQTAGSPSGVLEEMAMVVTPPYADRVDLLSFVRRDIHLHTGQLHADLSLASDRPDTILGSTDAIDYTAPGRAAVNRHQLTLVAGDR